MIQRIVALVRRELLLFTTCAVFERLNSDFETKHSTKDKKAVNAAVTFDFRGQQRIKNDVSPISVYLM